MALLGYASWPPPPGALGTLWPAKVPLGTGFTLVDPGTGLTATVAADVSGVLAIIDEAGTTLASGTSASVSIGAREGNAVRIASRFTPSAGSRQIQLALTGSEPLNEQLLTVAAGYAAFVSALGIYQPENFGAIGNNATDNAAALTACVGAAVAAGGGGIWFGPGIFRSSGTMLANADNISFHGVLGSTIVRTTHPTAPVFDFGDNVTLRSFLGITELRIDTAVTRTGGAFIRARKTADLNLTRLRLDGAFYGVDLLDTQITRLTDLHIINTVATTGECIRADSTGSGSNLYLTRVATDAPAGAQPRAGLSVKRWDGVFLTDTQFNHSGTGCILEPPAGQNCDHIFAVDCSFDSNSGDGLYTPAGGGVVRRAWFTDCWFGSNDGNGVRLDGGMLGFAFVTPKLFNNGSYGLILVSGTFLTITDVQASGNSRQVPGTTDAILISVNMTYVTILGGLCRPFGGFANTQRRGITINPGADHITVRDVDCDGNVNAVGISNLSSASDIVFRTNRGYVTENKGTVVQGSAAGFVDVTHGLDVTPNLQDITITPCTDLGAVSKFYISTITATLFRINTAGAPGAAITWAWKVQV